MANINFSIKLLACASVACGVTTLPISFGISDVNNLKEGKIDIKLENFSKGVSLGLKNSVVLLEKLKKVGNKVTFKEVGMKWGDRELSETDILTSPCQNSEYYLMRFIGGSRYQLEDGRTVFRSPRCGEKYQYEHLNYVSLKWRTLNRLGSVSLSNIAVGSCDFTKISDHSFSVTCYEFYRGGKKSGEVVQGILKFKE